MYMLSQRGIYIYIYREREREGEREAYICKCFHREGYI